MTRAAGPQCPAPWSRIAPRCSLMRNTIRMNSAAMREKMMPTTTLAIEDNSRMNPPNGLIAIVARPEKMPEMPNSADQRDDQPVEGLDDGGRDEAVPLKQIPKFKHRSFSRQVEYELRPNPVRTRASSECCPGQDRGRAPNGGARPPGTSHARGRLEIAANNGHNRASLQQSPFNPHDADLRRFSARPFRHIWSAPRHARGDACVCRGVRSAADASRRRGRLALDAEAACPVRAGICARS